MAKLTKAQRQELEQVRHGIEQGMKFINDPRVAVCWLSPFPPTNKSDFGSHDGKQALSPLAKDAGSGMVGFRKALRAIDALLGGE